LPFPNPASIKITGRQIQLPKLGSLKISKFSLPHVFRIKTAVLKKECDQWFVILSVEVPNVDPLEPTGSQIGLDLGILKLATLSDGTEYENPRWTKKAATDLARRQRSSSRKKRGSKRQKKAILRTSKLQRRIARKRKYELDRVSNELVRKHDLIGLEDLNVAGMSKGKYSKSINDAAWTMLTKMITYKAEKAGRRVVFVNPRGTTQNCSGCGVVVKKTIRIRDHECPDCGLKLDRDLNAAINIRERALLALRREDPSAMGPQ
jgi:putative transposase